MALNNKVAIVTGGNSGIGKAIALGLAKAGAFIVIDYIADPMATSALEAEIAALGERSIGVEVDVSKVADLQRAVRRRRRGVRPASTSWSTTPASRPAPRCSTRPRLNMTRFSRSI